MAKTGGVQRSHSTYHRWVLDTEADEIKVPEEAMAAIPAEGPAPPGEPVPDTPGQGTDPPAEPSALFADGTRYKGRDAAGHTTAGELRVLVGVRRSGEAFAIGAWTGKSWEEIGKDLEERKIRLPARSVLVTDGESPIAEGLASLANWHQRCQWHVARDLYFSMHEQGATAAEVRPWRDRLWKVMGVELPADAYDVVPDTVKEDVQRRLAAAETGLSSLIAEIRKAKFEIGEDHTHPPAHLHRRGGMGEVLGEAHGDQPGRRPDIPHRQGTRLAGCHPQPWDITLFCLFPFA